MSDRFTRRGFLGAVVLGSAAATASAVGGAAYGATKGQFGTLSIPSGGGLLEVEREYGVQLGVHAVDTGTGSVVAHRNNHRFAFCSVFKALAVGAVLHHHPMSHLNDRVHYTTADLMSSSFVTRDHVDSGMTIRELCDAAVRYSDGTAGNLLLKDIGGPRGLTSYARQLGDQVTRMDRWEPDVTTAEPEDQRDTSSPSALVGNFSALVIGDALPLEKRAFLSDLLTRNTTGGARIKAALPRGWTIGDKTGSGDYGTANDVAVVWRPDRAPIVMAIMSRKERRDAERSDDAIRDAAACVFALFA